MELVAVTVTENDAVASELSETDDRLVFTIGGVFALVVSDAVTLTSPPNWFVLATVIVTVPVELCGTATGELDDSEKSPWGPSLNMEPVNGVSPKPTVSSPAPANATKSADNSRTCFRMPMMAR